MSHLANMIDVRFLADASVAEPTGSQLAVLGVVALLFLVSGLLAVFRSRRDRLSLRISAKAFGWSGVAAGVLLLVWHASQRHSFVPLDDNFEAFIWLSLLLAAMVLYVQRTQPVAGLDWFAMPIAIGLLGAAAYFGREHPTVYLDTLWSYTHRASAFGGAVAFAVAGTAGAVYLVASQRLRKKSLDSGQRVGSLERLEAIIRTWVVIGFALLSVALVTGLMKVLQEGGRTRLGPDWFESPKVVLTAVVWLLYAAMLHTPLGPGLRGRRAAIVSLIGLLLMVFTLIAVQMMPPLLAGMGGGQ
jgi:ABC-type transport system involved in cytochrome c biogenesis permease subunit